MSLASELHHALEIPRIGDMTLSVHELVANALTRLDPNIQIKRTDYFNHSFVPDLVLRWERDGESRERYVHLRFNIVDKPFEQDLGMLAEASPVFIGMTDRDGLSDAAWRSSAVNANGTLVTQTAAIDDLDGAVQQDHRSQRATGPLVRVGHGLLDGPRASAMSDALLAAWRDINAEDIKSARTTMSAALVALQSLLTESGEHEVEHGFQSEWVRSGHDPSEFPASTPWHPELVDRETLREILASLLVSERSIPPETWVRNAGFISAEEIRTIVGSDVYGERFNSMAHALLPNWTAEWVWAERRAGATLFESYSWFVEGGILGLEANDLKVYFADDGRHFKEKASTNQLPRLSDAQDMLSEPGVQNVGLRTAREGIRYEPLTGHSSLFERLMRVLAPSEVGDCRVQFITTMVPGTDRVADLDLGRQIIDLRGDATPIALLARLAVRFFSRAPSVDGLNHFLATGELLNLG